MIEMQLIVRAAQDTSAFVALIGGLFHPGGNDPLEFFCLLEAVDLAIEKGVDFKPDVVGVSAGFDGYHADRLLDLNYTLEGYYQCGRRLGQVFGHIFAVLEGGYHLDIRKCTEHFISGVDQI